MKEERVSANLRSSAYSMSQRLTLRYRSIAGNPCLPSRKESSPPW